MSRFLRGAALGVVVTVAAAVAIASCSDSTVGPDHPLLGRFAVAPTFASQAAGIIQIARIRFVLDRSSDSSVARDTVVDIPAGSDSVSLELTVPVLSSAETFSMYVALITPSGDTAFRAGPVTVSPATEGAPPVVPVTFVYSGVGANAAGVRILTPDTATFFGESVVLNAEAIDSAGHPIAGTPIEWRSLDTARATVPAADSGRVLGGSQRGPAQIVAQLLSGQTDTASVLVQPLPSAILANAGDGQTATVDSLLAQPLVAVVNGSDNLGVQGIWVHFGTASGGTLSVDSARTDTSGQASVTWRLGSTAGNQTAFATTGALPGDTATFTAAAAAGTPASLTVSAGNGQTGTVSTAVAIAPTVLVADAHGNPVPNTPVAFQVTQGGGSLGTPTPTTNAAGLATPGSWTLGPAVGSDALQALVIVTLSAPLADANPAVRPVRPESALSTKGKGGLDSTGVSRQQVTGTPQATATTDTFSVTFTATAIAAPPSVLAKVSGDAQTATAGAALADSLVVKATDAFGNVTPGATVAWTVSAGGGTLTADTTTADAQGLTYVRWTLGTVAGGAQTVIASLVGATAADTFSATAAAGAPGGLAFTTQPPSNTPAAASFPVTVAVQDAHGNTVTGDDTTVVTLAIAGGTGKAGATLSGTASLTVSAGVASFTGLAIDSAGTGYQLSAAATGLTSATSAAFNVTVGSITTVAISPTTRTLGSLGDTAQFAAVARDAGGNLVSGATFAWSLSDSAVASVDASGVLTAVQNGSTYVRAGSGGIEDSALVAVTQIPTGLAFTTQPSAAAGGAVITPAVQVSVVDSGGAVVPTATDSINIAIGTNPSGGTLSGKTGAAAVAGVATFSNLSIDLAGTGYTLGAAASGLTSATSNAFDVTVGGIATVAITPTSRTLQSFGDTAQFGAVARDGGGNVVSGATFTWSLSDSAVASVDASGVVTAAQNGNTYVRAAAGGVTDSALVTVTQLAAGLAFTVQPTPVVAHDTIAPTVQAAVVDSGGSPVIAATNTVAIAIATNPSAGTLLGHTSVAAVAGVATFDSLTIDNAGTGYTLAVSSSGLSPDTSAAFDVTAPPSGVHWINVAGGNWSTASNWSTGVVPSSTDTVFIDASGTYTVTIDANATVKAMEVGASSGTQTLALASPTLTVDSSAVFHPNTVLQMTGGTLGGAGAVTDSGAFNWAGGTISGTGSLTVATSGTWTISGGVKVFSGGYTLANAGAATWTAGNINAGGGAAIDNLAGGTFDIQAPVQIVFNQGNPAPTFTNAGTLVRSTTTGTGAATLSVALSNTTGGVVNVQADTLTITNQGGTDAGGSYTIQSGAVLAWNGGTLHTFDPTSSVSGTGTMLVTGSGTATVTGSYAAGGTAVTGGTLSFSGTSPATTTTLAVSGGTLGGSDSLKVSGAANWTGGSLNGTGVTLIQAGGTLAIGGVTKTFLGGYTLANAGSATWTAGNINSGQGAAIDNLAGGTFDIQAPVQIVFNQGNPAPTFTNAGTLLRSTTTGTGAATLAAALANTAGATLDIALDTLTLSQGLTLPSGAVAQGTGVLNTSGTAAAIMNGDVKPGADTTGILRLQTGYDQGTTGRLLIDLRTPTAGTGYDQLIVGDSVSLTGAIVVDTLTGFTTPTATDSFAILTYATGRLSGTPTLTLPVISGLTVTTATSIGTSRDTLWVLISSPLGGAPPGTTTAWTGTVDTTWSNGANWTAGTAPIPTDNVWIKAGTPFQPIVSSNVSVNNLILQTGATVNIDTTFGLSLTGNLNAGYASIHGPGLLILTGAGDTASGNVPTLSVAGSYTLSDSLIVTSNLVVSGSLDLGGHRAAVAKNFSTSGTGTITMTAAADSLVVDSIATFSGGSTSGLLTAGTLVVGGAFVEGGGNTAAFAPSGSHVTILNGTASQTVGFTDPTTSQFNALTLANTVGTSFSSDVVTNTLSIGTGHPLTAAGRVTVTTGNVTIPTGTTLTIPWLQVAGVLNADTTAFAGVDTTVFAGAAQTIPDTIPLKTVYVTGTGVSFPSPGTGLLIALNGALHIEGTGATLTLNGRHVHVVGDSLFVGAAGNPTGRLVMSNATDSLVVDSTAIFQGASTAGGLSAGVLELDANFVQLTNGGAGDNFAPTGTQLTRFYEPIADFPQSISFQNPGASFFNDVVTNNGGAGDTLLTDAVINGNFNQGDDFHGKGARLEVVGNLTTSLTLMQAGRLILHAGFQADSQFYGVDTTEYAGTAQTVIGLPYTNLLVSGTATFTGKLALGGFLQTGAAGQLTTSAASDTIIVPGNIVAEGNGITGSGVIEAGGTTANLRGTVPNLYVLDQRTLDSTAAATGKVTIAAGYLDVGGQKMTVGDSLITNGTGALQMKTATDSLLVQGNAVFSGASTSGLLTAGLLQVGGNFQEGPNAVVTTSFAASAGHKTVLAGTGAQTVTFQHPADTTTTASQFGELAVAPGGNYTLGSRVWVADSTIVSGILNLGGQRLKTVGNFVTNGSGTIAMQSAADTLAIQGNAQFDGGDEFTAGLINNGRIFLQGNFTQLATNSQSSFYASSPNQVRFIGFNPQTVSFATGGNVTSRFGDVTVTGAKTVTLATFVDIQGFLVVTDSSGGATPVTVTGTDPNGLRVDGNVKVLGGLSTGGSLLNPNIIFVGDTLSGTGGGTFSPGIVQFDGNASGPQVIPTGQSGGTFTYASIQVNNANGVRFESSKTITSQLLINSGHLIIDSATITVSGSDLNVTGTGLLTMNGGALDVRNATFGGGDETGQLVGGTLTVRGNFSQTSGNSALSFAADTGFVTTFAGTTAQTITFASPDTAQSHFGILSLNNSGGSTQLASMVVANSRLQLSGVRQTVSAAAAADSLILRGATGDSVTFNGVPVVIVDGSTLSTTLNGWIFGTYGTGDDQLRIRRSSGVLTFGGWTFNTAPSGGGHYLVVADADGTSSTPFTILMSGPSPATPASLSYVLNQTAGVATIVTWGTDTF